MANVIGNAQNISSVAVSTSSISTAIGTSADSSATSSISGRTLSLQEHTHSASQVYPTLAGGVVVTASATIWTLGSIVNVIPANTIVKSFDIHGVTIEAFSANVVYELVLYSDSGGVNEIGRIRIVRASAAGGYPEQPFQDIPLPANNGVWAKVASSTAAANTITISLRYHLYNS